MSSTSACPVCGGASSCAMTVPFINTKPPIDKPLINFQTSYHACECCGAYFVHDMMDWTPAQFKECCYNDCYYLHDGDICNPEGDRPVKLVKTVNERFSQFKTGKHLDYGCGEGYAIDKLTKLGWNSTGYDPYHTKYTTPVEGRFDLITCVEVLEHAYILHDTFEFFKTHLTDRGVIYTTTMVHDNLANKSSHGYFCPRVGHIFIHTYKSLNIIATKAGMRCVHLNVDEHLFI